MRFLKKYIRKLYHLIWFLSLFFFFIPNVFAVSGQVNGSIYSSDISASPDAQFYDVNFNSISTTPVVQYSYSPYYQVSSRYNGYLSFALGTYLSTDIIYSLTVYLNDNSNSNLATWNNHLATSTYNGGAMSNNSAGSCRVTLYNSADTWNVKYKINFTNDVPTEVSTGAYYFIFSPTCAGSYINIPFSFSASDGYDYFYGFSLEALGNSNGLTSSQVQSIVSGSGLATASSVQEVQRGVSSIQNELAGIQDSNAQNTQDIINNQNENTNKTNETIEEQFNDCTSSYTLTQNNAKITGYYLRENSLFQFSTGMISDYLMVKPSATYTITNTVAKYYPQVCQYDKDKTLLLCTSYTNRTSFAFTSATNTKYVRFSNSQFSNVSISGEKICSNRFDTLNNNLTDSSVDSSDSTINSLKNQLPTNSVISDLLLLPVRLLQAIVNSLGGTCTSFNLGSLYGTNLIMPCIDIQNYLGTTIWSFIDLVFSGMFILVIRKKFIEIFQNITNLRNGGNEVD